MELKVAKIKVYDLVYHHLRVFRVWQSSKVLHRSQPGEKYLETVFWNIFHPRHEKNSINKSCICTLMTSEIDSYKITPLHFEIRFKACRENTGELKILLLENLTLAITSLNQAIGYGKYKSNLTKGDIED